MRSDVLAQWLLERRWFAGKGRQIEDVAITATPWIVTEPAVRIELATVRYADGDAETYQVPIEYRMRPDDALAHALIGAVAQEGGSADPLWAYDALHDKDVTGAWLAGMQSGRHEKGLSFHREPGATALPTDEPSLVLSAEQSNTSLVFGDSVIMKVFRRPADGLNPDVELHHALAEVDNPYVAALLGWVDGAWTAPDGAEHHGTLAIAQEFLRSATVGWDLAITSVRALFAEPDGLSPADSGGDFAGDSRRLGQATAAVHADLARVLGSAELSGAELGEVARGMTARLHEASVAVPALAPHAERIAAVYAELAAHTGPMTVQRVHGDLHLGQVMRVPTGWRIIDFEGEPARPLAERRMPHSPLKDVAGMLRSFDYAARHLLGTAFDGEHGAAAAAVEQRAHAWAEHNATAYLDGYLDAAGDEAGPADPLPLRAFVLDKAVYEVVYETRNRPDWVGVPLAAIAHLVGAASDV